MTYWILATLLVFFIQSLLPVTFRYFLRSDPKIWGALGARNNPPDTSLWGDRSERALRNTQEGLLIFLPLAILTLENDAALMGAQIFFWTRLAYIPAYILGIPVLRTAIWTVGVLGLAIMALAIGV